MGTLKIQTENGFEPIGGGCIELDTTLTQSGKAADAKAVGDALAELEAQIPESGGITQETDPTVPAWAKNPTKPSYTAEEVGALPADTEIPVVPTNVSAFGNDKGYLTEQDLSGYAKSEDIPTKPSDIGAQPAGSYATKDEIPVVPAIPTTLPNPHKLTFSGAVSAEYDGSEAVEVVIPQGYTKTEIDAIMGSYITDIDNLVGGDS